jgi:hypothetical protein
MAGATEDEIHKVVNHNLEPMAERLRKAAPRYLADHPDLIKRLDRVLGDGIQYMRERGDLAHSTWILDETPKKPPGFDTRLHIKSEETWYVGGKAFDSLAEKLGLISVKLIELMTDVLKSVGREEVLPLPEHPKITRP